MQFKNFVRIQYLYRRERKLGGSQRIGMQAAENKRALPLLGTKSRIPDCPVRSIVSTLSYPEDVAQEGFLK